MRLLFDTNVLIHVEDPKELAPELQELLSLVREHGHKIITHSSSFDDISRDGQPERRAVTLSKLKSYPQIEKQRPPTDFLDLIQAGNSANEQTDAEILYALHRNDFDFLITEDVGIIKKATRAGCEDRVFTIAAALKHLKSLHERWQPEHNSLKNEPVSHLDVKDSFFDALREDYKGFDEWFGKISREGRKCWHFTENGKVKALMIIKEEDEPVETTPPLPKLRRLKISTLKVDLQGSKIGELFLKIAFDYCVKNGIPEVYLTHFVKPNDGLVALLNEFEFSEYQHASSKNKKGEPEHVFVKSFVPTKEDEAGLNHIRFAKKYYPLFRDAPGIRKFLVPIRPEYHNRLFPNFQRSQKVITDYEMTSYGNAIKKAYLCHSGTTRLASGDILIFYRSGDEQSVGCFGVVEETLRSSDADAILWFVGKRTVYSESEVKRMKKPILAILFRYHLESPEKLNLEELCKRGILKAAPQSIKEINNNQYSELKKGCKLDEYLAVP